MRRANHYEAAFEYHLRSLALPFIAVDEARRSLLDYCHIKSFDAITCLAERPNLLIDVKGRRATGSLDRLRFDAWATCDDLDGLATWQNVFGPDYVAVLVFAFWIDGAPIVGQPAWLTHFRGKSYRFLAIRLDGYRSCARKRSAKWNTVALSTADFRRHAVDFHDFRRICPAIGSAPPPAMEDELWLGDWADGTDR